MGGGGGRALEAFLTASKVNVEQLESDVSRMRVIPLRCGGKLAPTGLACLSRAYLMHAIFLSCLRVISYPLVRSLYGIAPSAIDGCATIS
jgi:hypothetical protein